MTWRYLKGNKSSAIPRRLIFFDTETYRIREGGGNNCERHDLRLGVAKCGRLENGKLTRCKNLSFYSADEFWQFVAEQLSRDATTWLVAHNILYDLRAVRFQEQFEQALWVCDAPRRKRAGNQAGDGTSSGSPLVVLDNPPVIIGMRHVASGGRLAAVDLFNWFQQSLSTLGEIIGTPKLEMPQESASNEEWLAYCERDVDILAETFLSLVRWIEKHDLGMFRYSAAGQAMAAYRHRFMPHKICFHDQTEVKALERLAYFGGQSECWRIGDIAENVYHLDVTSLFPSVMRENQFPSRLLRCEQRIMPLPMRPDIDASRSIAEVVIKTTSRSYPFRHCGSTIYAHGCLFTCLAGPELEEASRLGHIAAWRSWAEYECKPLFTEYVDYLWQLKNQYNASGEAAYEKLAKMLLNSLYGKFGQYAPQWIDRHDMLAEMPWEAWSVSQSGKEEAERFRSIGYHVQQCVGRKERTQSFPAISAFVTAYARQAMRVYRRLAGFGNCYYQAVDSLIVNGGGYSRLQACGGIRESELGLMRLLRRADHCTISNIGDYSIADYIVKVGRKNDYRDNGDGSWRQTQFDGPHTLFRLRNDYAYRVREVNKRDRTSYLKGEVLPSGYVIPFCIQSAEPFVDGSGESKAIIDSTVAAKAESKLSSFPGS